ncbi:MAG TPA: hypothetical protein VFB14_22830 [Bryobacteraceae bacterium]|nr:hypothetical protein [Bryobacteraceae bacterium]
MSFSSNDWLLVSGPLVDALTLLTRAKKTAPAGQHETKAQQLFQGQNSICPATRFPRST